MEKTLREDELNITVYAFTVKKSRLSMETENIKMYLSNLGSFLFHPCLKSGLQRHKSNL